MLTGFNFAHSRPNPISEFVIGAVAFKTCPNQPVINVAQINASLGGMQASANATATAMFFARTIKDQLRFGDCDGKTFLGFDFDDPQGCNPPPPPPPPDFDPCGTDSNPDASLQPVCSPVIFDISGDGFHLTSAGNGVKFDISGRGKPIQIAWTAAGAQNGFLALDRNTNGVIDDGTELFGNFTLQPTIDHPNGFNALSIYDKLENGGNEDGIIDANDRIFSYLRVWIDANHDGVSQKEEVHTLAEMEIVSIDLRYSLSEKTDDFGNLFRYKAKINKGAFGPVSDVGSKAYDVFLAIR